MEKADWRPRIDLPLRSASGTKVTRRKQADGVLKAQQKRRNCLSLGQVALRLLEVPGEFAQGALYPGRAIESDRWLGES